MKTNEMLDLFEGIPNKDEEKKRAQEYYKTIGRELKKLSKTDAFGQNLKAVYLVSLIIDEECDDKTHPNYSVYANGTSDQDLQVLIDVAIRQFVDEGHYNFHYYYHQLKRQLPSVIADYLNDNTNMQEYWCRLLYEGMTASAKTTYYFVVLCFDKIGLETNTSYDGKRHPFLDSLKIEWSFGKVNDIDKRKICYNELYRRAASTSEQFVYWYEDIFNTLSAMKYESESNKGSILALRDKNFDKAQSNYDVSICFKQPIRIEEDSYKKIRKLLEITKNKLSLLMNGNGEIYAIGKMVENPSCEYYQIRFDGFLKWNLYKNNEKFLRFENMIPRIPDKENGISKDDIELLKKTFNITDTSKYEKIINEAVSQRHGTTVVFAENASLEANRLKESGICIEPIDVSTGLLVEAATAIDGALICDADGSCHSIGTILDGKTSKKADSSRGARYNSAIRYIEQQKKIKTFIVVVSEDGYVNCFSSLICGK